jgi:urease accessory protein UreE
MFKNNNGLFRLGYTKVNFEIALKTAAPRREPKRNHALDQPKNRIMEHALNPAISLDAWRDEDADLILVNRVLGHCDDEFWDAICERLETRGALEMLLLSTAQIALRHFRAQTDKGTIVGVSLREGVSIKPGSVVFYQEHRRIVLARLQDERVLVIATLNAFSAGDALILGHYLGNLGWQMHLRHHATHLEIFIPCTQPENEMEILMYDCPFQNIAWTFRDRASHDPI